ncbi:MAG: sigma factor [Gemmatimonadaceae bacterium]
MELAAYESRSSVNDIQLITRVAAGDAAAERELYETYVDRIYRLTFRLAGDDELARDFTQATFIRAFEKIDQDLKEKVMCSLSQQRGVGNEQWLMNIAVNPKEEIELRKKALFWAGQSGVATSELSGLYTRMTDEEMKDALIFTFSQRQSDRAAMDKLFDIAKNEKTPSCAKRRSSGSGSHVIRGHSSSSST